MIKLFEFLIYGCSYKWKTVKETGVVNGKLKIGIAIQCECEKCGQPKLFSLRA